MIIAGLLFTAPQAQAGAVWERILRSGEIRVVADSDAPPFSYVEGDGQFKGFAIDIIGYIHRAAQARAGKPLKLRYSQADFVSRLDQIAAAEADLECSQFTPTWTRHQRVDFSIPFMLSSYELVVDRDKIGQAVGGLNGMRVAMGEGGYLGRLLKRKWPTMQLLEPPDSTEAFKMIERGQTDVMIGSAVSVRAMLRKSHRRDTLQIYSPDGQDMAEPIACVLPPDDSEWRRLVDQAIGALFVGLDRQRGEYALLHARWFGYLGQVHYPLNEASILFLRDNAVARGVLTPNFVANAAQNPVVKPR